MRPLQASEMERYGFDAKRYADASLAEKDYMIHKLILRETKTRTTKIKHRVSIAAADECLEFWWDRQCNSDNMEEQLSAEDAWTESLGELQELNITSQAVCCPLGP